MRPRLVDAPRVASLTRRGLPRMALALTLVVASGSARAELVRLVDEDGVIHYTNEPCQPRYAPHRPGALRGAGPRVTGRGHHARGRAFSARPGDRAQRDAPRRRPAARRGGRAGRVRRRPRRDLAEGRPGAHAAHAGPRPRARRPRRLRSGGEPRRRGPAPAGSLGALRGQRTARARGLQRGRGGRPRLRRHAPLPRDPGLRSEDPGHVRRQWAPLVTNDRGLRSRRTWRISPGR
jgi:hypothetical protein